MIGLYANYRSQLLVQLRTRIQVLRVATLEIFHLIDLKTVHLLNVLQRL